MKLKFLKFILINLLLTNLSFALIAEETMRIGVTSLPTSRGNPFKTTTGLPSLYTHAAMFEGLTRVDNNANPVPMLAERWESESETSWLFYLRKNTFFSNGEPMDAYAVSFSFDLLNTNEGRGWNAKSELEGILSVNAIDTNLVMINTETPDILLPNKIASLKIIPPVYWSEVGVDGFASMPIGTGPFKVTNWGTARIQLERSESAWRQPYLNKLELITAPEPVSRVQGFLSGRFHIAVQLGPEEIPLIEEAGHKMIIGFDPSMQVLAFITEKESPLQDVRVRRALNYAVNRDAIVKQLLYSKVVMATQTTPSFSFGWDPQIKPWPYDPDKAKELLREAGYPDGFSFMAEILLGAASYSAQVYQQVAADLGKIGVNLSLRRIPASQYARGVYQGKWSGEAIGIDYGVNPTLDALTPLVRHSCLWPNPWFCEPSILPLIIKAQSSFDIEQRKLLTQKVMRYQLEFAPAIILYETTRFDAVDRNVKGYSISVGHINYDKLDFIQ